MQEFIAQPYELIVIGGGTAGCIMAARLSERAAKQVPLIEAGEDTPPSRTPADIDDIFPSSTAVPAQLWQGLKATVKAGQALRPCPQGRVMGGGSSIAGLVAPRGQESDYERWLAAGADGWSWDDVLPWLRSIEQDQDREGPDALSAGDPIRSATCLPCSAIWSSISGSAAARVWRPGTRLPTRRTAGRSRLHKTRRWKSMTEQAPKSRFQPTPTVIETPASSRSVNGLDGFEHRFETVGGVRLHYVIGGHAGGEVVVLLAGFPESWFAWRKLMPSLATAYRIIAPDLPGQGDSDRPLGGYDTQTLATTVHGLLRQLGIGRYSLVSHDVGAWVAYPYAALFGDEVQRLVLMDAGIPGITLPEALPTAPDRAWRTWHFAFHAIPDLPETLIAGREREYLDWFLRRKTADPETFSDADIAEYLRDAGQAGVPASPGGACPARDRGRRVVGGDGCGRAGGVFRRRVPRHGRAGPGWRVARRTARGRRLRHAGVAGDVTAGCDHAVTLLLPPPHFGCPPNVG